MKISRYLINRARNICIYFYAKYAIYFSEIVKICLILCTLIENFQFFPQNMPFIKIFIVKIYVKYAFFVTKNRKFLLIPRSTDKLLIFRVIVN